MLRDSLILLPYSSAFSSLFFPSWFLLHCQVQADLSGQWVPVCMLMQLFKRPCLMLCSDWRIPELLGCLARDSTQTIGSPRFPGSRLFLIPVLPILVVHDGECRYVFPYLRPHLLPSLMEHCRERDQSALTDPLAFYEDVGVVRRSVSVSVSVSASASASISTVLGVPLHAVLFPLAKSSSSSFCRGAPCL